MAQNTHQPISSAGFLAQFGLTWGRLPTVVRVTVTALVLVFLGELPWSVLITANLKLSPLVPWSVPVTVLFLWLFWQYLDGKGWPSSTAETRHRDFRARPLSRGVWGWSLLAGCLALVSLQSYSQVAERLVQFPQPQFPDVSQYPFLTVLLIILMGGVVAGVVEEAAFRGYMQAPLERRYGSVAAILAVGMLFGLTHFSHPEVSVVNMPYYLAAAVIYGVLAYRTGSILPSVILHAGGNALVDMLAWWRFANSASASSPAPLVWQSGIDLAFLTNLVGTALFGVVAFLVFQKLTRVMREDARQPEKNKPCGV